MKPFILEKFQKFKDFIRNGINIAKSIGDTQSILKISIKVSIPQVSKTPLGWRWTSGGCV
jgi:replicative superfamily II helicase